MPDPAQQFAADHKLAMLLRQKSLSDYCGARCCLLHGLFSGFQLSAQAIEKLLKSCVLLHDPTAKPRSLGHRLAPIARRLASVSPWLAEPATSEKLERFESLYSARYPDNAQQAHASTSELAVLDDIMIRLEETASLPPAVKVRSGIPVAALGLRVSGRLWPETSWLLQGNTVIEEPLLRWRAIANAIEANGSA